MSRNINVNPAHYKVAGRERQGEAILQDTQKQAFAKQQESNDRWQAHHGGGAPVGDDTAGAAGRHAGRASARRTRGERGASKRASKRVKPSAKKATTAKTAKKPSKVARKAGVGRKTRSTAPKARAKAARKSASRR